MLSLPGCFGCSAHVSLFLRAVSVLYGSGNGVVLVGIRLLAKQLFNFFIVDPADLRPEFREHEFWIEPSSQRHHERNDRRADRDQRDQPRR